jgi:hypothetical protein
MDKGSWMSLFATARSYGINHYRFHSWCPPKAAFEAADEIGMYLQPELSHWNYSNAFEDDEQYEYYKKEAEAILRSYGNHPSFVMFSWGNELSGSKERMETLVIRCKRNDPRRLYAIGSNNFFREAFRDEHSDYWTSFWTEGRWNFSKPGYGGKHLRGATPHITRGHINNEPPSTMVDYRSAIACLPVPVIGHETGQYQVFPDFNEVGKYRGVLKPDNLKGFQEQLERKGLLKYAEAFKQASGKLAVICYREEIEAALRTPGFGGFQLLDLQDFPGQGTALVGILDAFMESKGLIEPAQWRRFCSETVPLVRMKKYTWTNDELFRAVVEIAHYGPHNFDAIDVSWRIKLPDESLIHSGTFTSVSIPQGDVKAVGEIAIHFDRLIDPVKLCLEISIAGTDYVNQYPVWVYPKLGKLEIPEDITLVRSIDTDVLALLNEGRRVLVVLDPKQNLKSVEGAFIPDFWCYALFKKYNPPGTLGICCEPKHPVFAGFPTDEHSDWQWWNLVKRSRPLILDGTPPSFQPIVQVVDNIVRQHKLGLIYEASVGEGKVLVCSIDLLAQLDRPEARQLLESLIQYVRSDAFRPSYQFEPADFLQLHNVEGKNANVGKKDIQNQYG